MTEHLLRIANPTTGLVKEGDIWWNSDGDTLMIAVGNGHWSEIHPTIAESILIRHFEEEELIKKYPMVADTYKRFQLAVNMHMDPDPIGAQDDAETKESRSR